MESNEIKQIISALFLDILKRRPNETDLSNIYSRLVSKDVSEIGLMLNSPELLTRLIQRDTSGALALICLQHGLAFTKPEGRVEPTFFLHVPKTAGISIYAHLNEHSANPWIQPARFHSYPDLNIWPRWIAHYPLSEIATDVKVYSVTRDPITRLISAWMFYTSNSQALEHSRSKSTSMSLTRFLGSKDAKILSRGHDFYFWPNKYRLNRHPKDGLAYVRKHYKDLPNRIKLLASIEDPASIQKLLAEATNSSAPFEKYLNKTEEISEPKFISAEEHTKLFEFTKLEYSLMDYLFEIGMIGIEYSKDIEKKVQVVLTQKNISIR